MCLRGPLSAHSGRELRSVVKTFSECSLSSPLVQEKLRYRSTVLTAEKTLGVVFGTLNNVTKTFGAEGEAFWGFERLTRHFSVTRTQLPRNVIALTLTTCAPELM